MFSLIDSHNHLDDASFDADRDAVYQRARDAGVTMQILAAVSARLWPKLKTVVAQYPGLYPCYGLHPAYLAEHCYKHLDMLEEWLEREHPVAIGECGLDYYLPDLDPEAQITYFTSQLRLARRYDLPVVIHARHTIDQVIKYLRRFSGVRGVVHSFSGSASQAQRLLDMGIMLSFGGPVTYPRASRLRSLIRDLPLDSFLLETDAPDQPLSGHRDERNQPALLLDVLSCIAELRHADPAEIAEATTTNARRLFGISDVPSTGTH